MPAYLPTYFPYLPTYTCLTEKTEILLSHNNAIFICFINNIEKLLRAALVRDESNILVRVLYVHQLQRRTIECRQNYHLREALKD